MFGLQHPIVLAPMGGVSGGHLAATVSNAGGLGLVGGGYGDPAWLHTELSRVKEETRRPWGVGMITWSIDRSVFELALSYHPDAFMLSFGDPRPSATTRRSSALLPRTATRLHAPAYSTSCVVTHGRRHIPGAHFATASWRAGTGARAIWRSRWKPNVLRTRRLQPKGIAIRP